MATQTYRLNDLLSGSVQTGSSFWGGLSATFSINNQTNQSLTDWSFSFVSSYSNFDFYNANEQAVANGDGTYTITVSAAAGTAPLAAGASLALGFTVNSDRDAAVTLEKVVLAASGTGSAGPSSGSPDESTIPVADGAATSSTTTSGTGLTPSSGLSVEIQLGGSWSGIYEGTLTVRNASGGVVPAGWHVELISDHALRNISDFSVQQVQRSDGRYVVTLSAPSWSAGQGLAAGASLSSYFQASGTPAGQSVAELFEIVGARSIDGGSEADNSGGSTAPLPAGPHGLNSGNSGDAHWGEAFFAPYVDLGLWPVPDLNAIAVSRGATLLTLGFLQATASGQLAWAGLDALALNGTHQHEQLAAIEASIAAFQQAGGDVMISLGGMNGRSLAQQHAQAGLSAASLAAGYALVVERYGLNRLDFDIEGAAIADDAANALHSQALALLQQQKPDLEVWYTLPVLPTGLSADGLDLVRAALAAGVKLDGVNVMAMDYGESAAPTSGPNGRSMGAYAIQAAESTLAQLQPLFAGFNQGFSWSMLGVTPMIGVNDISSEVFTLADAQLLDDFAHQKGLGMLSMWSIARDTPGALGSASPVASGLDAPAGSFSAIFSDYGPRNTLSTGGDAGTTAPDGGDSGGTIIKNDAMRVVGYFEEWGIYGRDVRVADVKADALTHLNYSFFGITPTMADRTFMAAELNVLPGAMVQAGYLGLNSNSPGGLGIHDSWAAYEKTFTQPDQLVSRRFDADQWQALSEEQQQSYLSGGDFDVTVSNDGGRLVRARPDTWSRSQGGIQRTFNKADWDALSDARQAYLVEHSQQYSWSDQWQGSFSPSGSSTAQKIAAVDAHFAAGEGRSLTLRADGDLVRDASAWVGDSVANWQKLYAGNLNQLRLLKELHPDLTIGFAIGGWTLSGNFSTNLDDVAGREIFTQSIIDHLEYYDFFGSIDFDWEYPGGGGLASNSVNDNDGVNFALTLQLLDQKLMALEGRTGRSIEVSVAAPGGAEKLANLNLQGIDSYVDFYNVMTYDFHGGWENRTGHQAAMTGDSGGYDVVTAIDQFRQAGIAMDKVVLGAPAYTRAWGGVQPGGSAGYEQSGTAALAPGSFEKGTYDQKDLITGIEAGNYQLIWDDNNKAAFAYDASNRIWSSVETTATIAGKAAYVQEAGLGGMMFWAISNDSEGNQSLISAAHDALLGGSTLGDIAGRAPGFDQVIGGDGMFSISDFTNLS